MTRTDVLVIGAGQAGLAVSRLLTGHGVDHVVLERGGIAQRWRTRGWDSLRLLTPNWMSRLPGWRYRGSDPAGYRPAREVAGYLSDYAASFAAPVLTGTEVVAVRRRAGRYLVDSTAGQWTAPAVVVATGGAHRPAVPDLATQLHPSVHQFTANTYRNPGDLRPGGVLVVGASATGAQVADEIRSAGHDVVISVGRHSRLPRRYRGRDILDWLDLLGTLRRPLEPWRRGPEPSLQLVGDHTRAVDLPALAARGIRLAGRLEGIGGSTFRFADDLAATVAAADRRLDRMLARIDAQVAATGLDDELPAPERPRRLPRSAIPPTGRADLAGIRNVFWATGFRREHAWLRVPVLDATGEIRQVHGRTPAPGLFTVGLPNQTRRSSTLIDGVRWDAELVVNSLLGRAAGADPVGRAS
jgi:putative flavoprotein involved in K+ transport